MKLNRWIKWTVLTLAGTFVLVLVLVGAAAVFLSVRGVETVPLGSAQGQALLRGQDGPDYGVLKQNHVAQLRMHCYAASAAIVMNSLRPGEGYTQTNLFAPETADIITEDQLDDALFTLQKLVDIIHVRSGLQADRFTPGLENPSTATPSSFSISRRISGIPTIRSSSPTPLATSRWAGSWEIGCIPRGMRRLWLPTTNRATWF